MNGVEIFSCLTFCPSLYVCRLVLWCFPISFPACILSKCVRVFCFVSFNPRCQQQTVYHVYGNCYQNFVSLNFEVREFSSYSRGDFRLSYQFTFFCVIFLPISLRSLCSEAIQDLRPPRLGYAYEHVLIQLIKCSKFRCSNEVFSKCPMGTLSEHLTSVQMKCSESVPRGTLLEHSTGTISGHLVNVLKVHSMEHSQNILKSVLGIF